jgi:hypothetical protein
MPVILAQYYPKSKSVKKLEQKSQMWNFAKIRPAGVTLFHADRRKDRRVVVVIRFVKADKNCF